jgi:hypothetical protein
MDKLYAAMNHEDDLETYNEINAALIHLEAVAKHDANCPIQSATLPPCDVAGPGSIP